MFLMLFHPAMHRAETTGAPGSPPAACVCVSMAPSTFLGAQMWGSRRNPALYLRLREINTRPDSPKPQRDERGPCQRGGLLGKKKQHYASSAVRRSGRRGRRFRKLRVATVSFLLFPLGSSPVSSPAPPRRAPLFPPALRRSWETIKRRTFFL